MKHLISFFIVAALLILPACKSANPNPELSDPIYKSLMDDMAKAKAGVAAEEAGIKSVKDVIDKADIYGQSRGQMRKELTARESKLITLKQMVRYYELRAESRLQYVRAEYKKLFAQGKEWPPEGLSEEFKRMESLRRAPRAWGARVPKLQDRFSASTKAPASGSGGGAAAPPAH